MAFEQRDMTGALFKNNDKTEEHETWPDYQGSLTVEGQSFYLSAWLKTSKAGMKYMSLVIKPKDDGAAQSKKKPAGGGRSQEQDFGDETIPF